MQKLNRNQYLDKLRSAEDIAAMIKSGDEIFFSEFILCPESLDKALSARAEELANVKIDGLCSVKVPKFIAADPRGNTLYMMTGIFGRFPAALQTGAMQLHPYDLSSGASSHPQVQGI